MSRADLHISFFAECSGDLVLFGDFGFYREKKNRFRARSEKQIFRLQSKPDATRSKIEHGVCFRLLKLKLEFSDVSSPSPAFRFR
jgi:hypothetical protein